MRARTVLALVAAAVAPTVVAAPVAAAPAAAAPPPADQVVVELVKAHGSGCRQGSAVTALSADATAFTVTYSGYLAKVGVGARPQDGRKECRLDVRLRVPRGHTYAVGPVDHRGFAHLEAGATGRLRSGLRFQGDAGPVREHAFAGPVSDGWQTTEVPAPVWAPCGQQRHLWIETELEVAAGGSDPATTTSLLALDSADGAVTSVYRLAWRPCR